MSSPNISIIFRALNEEEWFADALRACQRQSLDGLTSEIILVDSGSTDNTLKIAKDFDCKIVHIAKADFTFGRSLNYGCRAANGDILVFISAHCIPSHDRWLSNLVQPLLDEQAHYVYGSQIGHEVSRFSEHQVFAQYFPAHDKLPQDNFFINNANSAILKSVWEENPFDEEVTGLEDMVLAKRLRQMGMQIGYIADAPVIHIHQESFKQTRIRYYREALTLRQIFPDMHFHYGDFIRFFLVGVFNDFSVALNSRQFLRRFGEIVAFRWMQYRGTYKGHNENRAISREQKEQYYYPKPGRFVSAPSANINAAKETNGRPA